MKKEWSVSPSLDTLRMMDWDAIDAELESFALEDGQLQRMVELAQATAADCQPIDAFLKELQSVVFASPQVKSARESNPKPTPEFTVPEQALSVQPEQLEVVRTPAPESSTSSGSAKDQTRPERLKTRVRKSEQSRQASAVFIYPETRDLGMDDYHGDSNQDDTSSLAEDSDAAATAASIPDVAASEKIDDSQPLFLEELEHGAPIERDDQSLEIQLQFDEASQPSYSQADKEFDFDSLSQEFPVQEVTPGKKERKAQKMRMPEKGLAEKLNTLPPVAEVEPEELTMMMDSSIEMEAEPERGEPTSVDLALETSKSKEDALAEQDENALTEENEVDTERRPSLIGKMFGIGKKKND